MLNATVTPCCQRRVHPQCYQTHVHTSNTCGHCREPFAVHEAQAMATVANPEPEHPFRQAGMELCEQQRQQAILVPSCISYCGDKVKQLLEQKRNWTVMKSDMIIQLVFPPTFYFGQFLCTFFMFH